MFQALLDRVIVDRDAVKKETESGIILQRERQEHPETGTVISVGSRVTGVVPGERVLFQKFGGQSIQGEPGQDLIVMPESHVMAVLEPSTAPS